MPAVSFDEKSSQEYVFAGPLVRRMSAEQFRDALGQLTGVWYDRAAAPIDVKPAHGKIRAVLANADALQVALGRPNREQTVTERTSAATTLEALELTNGRELTGILRRGAQNALKEKERPFPREELDIDLSTSARWDEIQPRTSLRWPRRSSAGPRSRPAWKICFGRWSCCRNSNLYTEDHAHEIDELLAAAAISSPRPAPPRSRRWPPVTRCAMLAAAADKTEEKIKPTADTVIVLWMAGGMAHTETFDPKRYTPFEKGLASNQVLCTFPSIDTAVDHIKFSQGLEQIAQRDGPRHADPLVQGGRPRLHPALAPSISMAHRLRAAADRRRAAHRRRHRPHARPAESGDAGVHRHRPALRSGRGRGTQGVSHGRVPGQRIRAVPHSRSRAGRRKASARRRA